jgi:hypothetical protein
MPDSTIYSHSSDSYTTKQSTSAFLLARGTLLGSGDSWSNTSTYSDTGVYAKDTGGRSGSIWNVHRSFFVFDLSSESGTIDTASIDIYMRNLGSTSGGSNDAILVEATALDGGVQDHGNVYQSAPNVYHDDISDVVTINTTAGYHTFTLNSDGIALAQAAIDSGGIMYVGLVSEYHDYRNNVPPPGGNNSQFQVSYVDIATSSSRPHIDIDYEAVSADNAIFFGANF